MFSPSFFSKTNAMVILFVSLSLVGTSLSTKLEICGNVYDKGDFVKSFQVCVNEFMGDKVASIAAAVLDADKSKIWQIFDNPDIVANPCLISCIMEKSGVQPDPKMFTEKIEQLLASANKPDAGATAAKIVETCLSSAPVDDSQPDGKCRQVLETAKCFTKEVLQACGSD